jgi:OFA family oxalate/formate antiporter-like MFS transporter
VLFLVSVLLGSIVLINPPKGFKPKGWEPKAVKNTAPSGGEDFTSGEMIRTYQFWFLWIIYAFSATAGLLVIGNIKLFGISALEAKGFMGDASAVAGTAMVIFALLNGLGRITWGTLSDKIGKRTVSILIMTLFQSVMMIALIWMGGTVATFFIAAALIGFNFGGNFSLFPTATADFFGSKNLGANYALVFTAYGLSGIIGPILGGRVFDMTGNYLWAFIPASALCFIGAILSLSTKEPHHKEG